MTPATTCPLCQQSYFSTERVGSRDAFDIDCQECGQYRISGSIRPYLEQTIPDSDRRILRGQTRLASRRGTRLEVLSTTLPGILAAAPQPTNPMEVADRILVDFSRAARPFFSNVEFEAVRYLDYFLPSAQDLYSLLHSLAARGYLRVEGQYAAKFVGRMELAGWERVRDVEHNLPEAWRAFVAMSFDTSLDQAWLAGIKPALEETGYTPLRVDEVQHLGKIDDVIVAQLRLASIVVADFSRHRSGVYFEAGFALGRGIPVVWTCRAADIGDSHFDTRQYNHVVWTDPVELRTKLRDRLIATVQTRLNRT